MKGLPKTTLWVGTWEILYEECIKACDKMKNSSVIVELYIGEKMGHEIEIGRASCRERV